MVLGMEDCCGLTEWAEVVVHFFDMVFPRVETESSSVPYAVELRSVGWMEVETGLGGGTVEFEMVGVESDFDEMY